MDRSTEHSKTYFSNVVAGDVKSSAGGSSTTSSNRDSATYRTGHVILTAMYNLTIAVVQLRSIVELWL